MAVEPRILQSTILSLLPPEPSENKALVKTKRHHRLLEIDIGAVPRQRFRRIGLMTFQPKSRIGRFTSKSQRSQSSARWRPEGQH
jgi:hypothetical protein